MSAGSMVGRIARALPDLARVSFAGAIAYRAEMAIWILTTLLPLIMLAMWNAVAEDGPIVGFDAGSLVRYFAINLLVRQLTSSWLVWELNYEIRTGRLSTKLLKPMHPFVQHGMDTVVAMPLRVAILIPILGLLFGWRPDAWRTPSPVEAALFVGSIAAAWTLNFLIQALIATGAFWIDKSDSVFAVWFAVWAPLSGYIAPIAMFPDWAQPIVRSLPFFGTLGLPVELLGGFVSVRDAALPLAIQLGWVGAMFGLVAFAWRRGIARYGAYGA
ncbi:MAG: ABC-2 family transporter protein [Myxococcota bacterium]